MQESEPSNATPERIALVTGANTGIGAVTARELAQRGLRVFLACRSEEKTKPVLDGIVATTGNERVEFLPLDLSDLDSVRACAARFSGRELPLHVLVNNAGLAGQRGFTASGFELAFGVNHVGHFLLSALLYERLKAARGSRVVHVASQAHYGAHGIDFESVRRPTASLTGLPEYGVSKLANVLFSNELARRGAAYGIHSYSLHPGVVATDVWRRIPAFLAAPFKAFMLDVERGARTSVYCATSPEVATSTGCYYERCAEKTPSAPARDTALAAELWRRSEEWTDAEFA